ncbi:MAG: hypothetical protein KatS3mg043_1742 [Rhodothermaceae bacterium]|nr:MAG: hypothetical protein KatS3mg043_1742 [Rhodothermaceae bacterium]
MILPPAPDAPAAGARRFPRPAAHREPARTAHRAVLRGLWYAGLWLLAAAAGPAARAQTDAFDPAWYHPDRPYLKVGVVEDGVYRLTGQDLAAAGLSLAGIDPATFRLFENGREVPLHYEGTAGTMQPGDFLAFVGRRNRGDDEAWAYNYEDTFQSSTFFSLYTDTTYYWLTWNGPPGLRYATPGATGGLARTTARDTLHLEEDALYFFGDPFATGNPLYTRGEGYYWDRFAHTSGNPITRTYDAILTAPAPGTPDTLRVRVQLNAETSTPHRVILSLRLREGSTTTFVPVDTASWSGTAFAALTASVPQDRLPADGNLAVRLTSTNDFDNTPVNRVLLDWIEVVYTRSLTASANRLSFAVPEGGTYRFTLSGFSDGPVWVFAPAHGAAFARTAAGGIVTVEDAPPGAARYWAVGATGFRTPARLHPDTPSDWANPASEADYVIVTTPVLWASAEALAAYRSGPEGGNHTVVIVDVQDVFDQFDYGRPTPLALRRFVRTTQAWATPPRFLVLWGDALYPNRTRPRPGWEVPSFGHAASDGWFAMQQDGLDDYTERLAVGRLPLRDNDTGFLFVEKLAHYESRPLAAWQKRALFLVGGTSALEQSTLQSFALEWSRTVHHTPAALDTLHFFKNASEPLDPTFRDSLQVAFRNGASWVTYFGHSAAQTWEIVTAPPRTFDNADRLPVVLSLGCFTGDFATGTGAGSDLLSFSEQLVLETRNGSIAHWGASSSGTILASAQLSDEIHRSVFVDTLRTLGLALQEAKRRYSLTRRDPLAVKHVLQYGLIGDPATRLSLPTRPDFTLTPAALLVTPEAPIPADSALTVTVRARNYGLLPADSVDLELLHTAPGGATTRHVQRLPPFGLEHVAAFTIPLDADSPGEHRLRATLDPPDAYAEEDETNNVAERTQVVFSTGLSLVEPGAFGLVPTPSPTLRVSLADPMPQPVLFQLDVAPTFDTPALRVHRTPPARLAATWQPDGLTDGTTYYWRARIDQPDQAENWKTGILTVDTALGQTGWLQQGPLFRENTQSPFLEHTGTAWRFKTYAMEVSAASSRDGGPEVYNGQFVVNSELYERNQLGFGLLVLDGGTGAVRGHGSMPTYPNNFEDPAAAFAELQAVAALARPGDYVLARTRHKGNRDGVTVIPDSVKAVFRALGSTAIDTLTYRHLWIMISRVDDPAFTLEWVAPPDDGRHEIMQAVELTFRFGEGTTLSPPIGPAQAWHTLGWAADTGTSGTVRVAVLSADGAEVLIDDRTIPGTVDLSALDARRHPFIRLRATLADTTARTTPQLTRWYVGYDAVPELALDPATLTLSADTLLEGAPLEIGVTARNLSATPAETALLDYLVIDPANETTRVHTDTLRNLVEAASSTFTLPTRGRVGTHRLQLVLRQPERPEQAVFNNLLRTPFVVRRDATPPSFDVLIDGIAYPHDPDPVVNLQDPALPFVPARPTIEITVRDDNPFIPLQGDTTVVTVTLDDRRIPFDRLAGKRNDNELRLRFQPDFSGSDSTHTLVVHVRDGSGNEAEGSPYQVHFRTATDLRIEPVYPYPNPMNNFTVFAFRLIGPDAARIEDFRLRLYTITGRLLREFDLIENPALLEGGSLRIGWNKVRWDGTDADGDPVATGVYLYRVFARTRDGGDLLNEAARVEKVVVIR